MALNKYTGACVRLDNAARKFNELLEQNASHDELLMARLKYNAIEREIYIMNNPPKSIPIPSVGVWDGTSVTI